MLLTAHRAQFRRWRSRRCSRVSIVTHDLDVARWLVDAQLDTRIAG